MEANSQQDAYRRLIYLAEQQGYLTLEDIDICADDYSLPIQNVEWLCDSLRTQGVLIYSENPNIQVTEEDEYDDFAQSDYEIVYNRLIELCPSLETFVTQVKHILPPQYREISKLIYQIQDGNIYAQNRMIEMNLRLALRIALNRAELYDLDIDNTIGDACIGLINAVKKYGPEVRGAFSSYASSWVLQNISRAQDIKCSLIYYPTHRKELFFASYPRVKERGCIGCEKMIYCRDLHEYIKDCLNCDDAEVKCVISQMIPCVSMQEFFLLEERVESENYYDISDNALQTMSYSDEEEMLTEVCRFQLSAIIKKVLATLRPKEAEVIRLRYGFYGEELTLEEVGKRYNITRERVRQIEQKTIRRLKNNPLLKSFLDQYY